MVDEEGRNSERYLKLGNERWGSLKNLSKNVLNREWVTAEVVYRGQGVRRVSPQPP